MHLQIDASVSVPTVGLSEAHLAELREFVASVSLPDLGMGRSR